MKLLKSIKTSREVWQEPYVEEITATKFLQDYVEIKAKPHIGSAGGTTINWESIEVSESTDSDTEKITVEIDVNEGGLTGILGGDLYEYFRTGEPAVYEIEDGVSTELEFAADIDGGHF